MYTYKNNTDLQQFIEDTYLQDKKLITKSFDEIDIELYEINEKLKVKEIKIYEDNDNSIENEIEIIESKLNSLNDTLNDNIQSRIDYECYENIREHKKLKKLVKLAVLSKFI